MPPRSYLAIAAGLAALVAMSASLTSGSSIFAWQRLIAASGCILGVVGAIRAISALGAPRWVAAAFALPALIWAMNIVKDFGYLLVGSLGHYEPARLTDLIMIYTVGQIASLAAAAGALRLVEAISAPNKWLRFGYAVLAAHAIVVCVGLTADILGWHFAGNARYAVRGSRVAATFVGYAALIGAAVLLIKRHAIEPWAGIVIGLIGCFMSYHALQSVFGAELRTAPSVWPQTLIMFIGGVAAWRIGSQLSSRPASGQTEIFETCR